METEGGKSVTSLAAARGDGTKVGAPTAASGVHLCNDVTASFLVAANSILLGRSIAAEILQLCLIEGTL